MKNQRQRFRWLAGWTTSSYARFIVFMQEEIYRGNNVRNSLFCTSTTMRFSISSQFKLLHFLFVSLLCLSLFLSLSVRCIYIVSSLAHERVATIILPLLCSTTAQTMYSTYNKKKNQHLKIVWIIKISLKIDREMKMKTMFIL